MQLTPSMEAGAGIRPAQQSWLQRINLDRLPFVLCQLPILFWVIVDLKQHAAFIWLHAGAPYQFDYEEGNILNALVRITHGLSPYPDPNAVPSVLNPYGPVAYYLLAVPVKLFGVSLLVPRVVIVASVVAICCMIGLTLARVTRSALTGAVFGGMYGTLPLVQGWSSILRIDFLAIALCSAGIYVFCRGLPAGGEQDVRVQDEWRSRTHRWTAAAFFAAALLVKYSYLAAPAACVLFLLLRRRWRHAFEFTAIVAALVLSVLALAAVATHGAILVHLFRTHPDPYILGQYLMAMRTALAMWPHLLGLAGVFVLAGFWRRNLSVPLLWLLLATAATLTAGKLGSNWNHFLEWPAVLCLCAGLGWDTLSRIPSRRFALGGTLIATLWLTAQVATARSLPYGAYNDVDDCGELYQLVQSYPGDRILSENIGALVLGGKTVWVSNPFVYSQMVMHGGMRDQAVEPRLRSRWFDLVITREYGHYPRALQQGVDRWSGGMLQALNQNYRVTRTLHCREADVVWERLPVESK